MWILLNKQKPKSDKKGVKKDIIQSVFALFEGIEMIYDAFENWIISLEPNQGTGDLLDLACVAEASDCSQL